MTDGSEFQTATLKPREAKVTRGTDNRLVFVEQRTCGRNDSSEGNGSKQAEWSRECCLSHNITRPV